MRKQLRRNRRRRNRRVGLTLVELLLALAISAMLLAAAMRVTMTASRCSAGRDELKNAICCTQLERLLTMDIQDAESYMVTKDGVLIFKNRSRLDEKSLTIKHEPSTVAYRVITAAGKSWLVREQDSATGKLREFAAADAEKIAPGGMDAKFEYDTWQEMTESFSVKIDFATTDKQPLKISCILK